MNIYFDESGTFQPCSNKASCLGMLAIPSREDKDLKRRFVNLRRSWGCSAEIKGSELGEKEINETIELLYEYDVCFDICVMNMQENEHTIMSHQQKQTKKLWEHLTDKIPADTARTYQALSGDVLKLSPQEYVQFEATITLIGRALQAFLAYYSLRDPAELCSLRWIFDSKRSKSKSLEDQNKNLALTQKAIPTALERLIQKLAAPMFAYSFPLGLIQDGDYSHFFRSYASDSRSADAQFAEWKIPDIGLGLFKDMHFESSIDNPGLQLVDILVSAVTRAINGALGEAGWSGVGRFFVFKKEDIICFKSFNVDESGRCINSSLLQHEQRFANQIRAKAKSLFPSNRV